LLGGVTAENAVTTQEEGRSMQATSSVLVVSRYLIMAIKDNR